MAQRVVVVALVEGHVAFACGVIKARARGEAALAAPEDGATLFDRLFHHGPKLGPGRAHMCAFQVQKSRERTH